MIVRFFYASKISKRNVFQSITRKHDALPHLRKYSSTTKLPNKVQFVLSKMEREKNVTREIQPILGTPTTEINQIFWSKDEGNLKLEWVDPPRSVLIVKKPSSEPTSKAFTELVKWFHDAHPDLNIIVESDVAEEFRNEFPFVHVAPPENKYEYTRVVDFVITLGGDGTILHVSSLFEEAVPPAISDLIKGGISLLLRMRLTCALWTAEKKRVVKDGQEIGDLQAMNEVNLHRGRYPHLAAISCYVNEQFLTEAVADGLIVATPTGSTAYSLSAGMYPFRGPIIHPSVQGFLLTPICPRSLSFRPVLIPQTAKIQLKISKVCRSPTEITVDGREICMLNKGDFLEVQASSYPMPCVNRVEEGVDWVKDINNLLKWNQNFVNKQLLIHGLS
ncbi:10942_t:CDS:10 [Acaulospora morrowiae]|uniref:10942_t:CDS:1 n=1 Tax=Acaulospora morrowiae TaxID=94023 RepID=A0A9N8YQ74_9GLOM|nr:10942_t:CDS:10 [Acaulospora morrowiae]